MKHYLEAITETPRYTQYRCRVCCRAFRVMAGTNPPIPEDCGEEVLPVHELPRQPVAEETDFRTPPAQVATHEERDRRFRICGKCSFAQQKICAPPGCHSALLNNCQTGICRLEKWGPLPSSGGLPPSEADQYAVFLAKWAGYRRTVHDLRVSTGKPHYREIRLYAMISTWHESDIVAAAVKNCFAEGCDRVYVLDNDSPDGTAHEAVKAGAILAQSYHTDYFQDVLRVTILNDIMSDITISEAHSELWWLCIDCDEFPRGPGTTTVRQYVENLPEDCNTVGADAFDHYPTEPTANVRGEHPAKFQPMGWLRRWPNQGFCKQGHWKHPLVRYRNGKYTAIFTRGLHEAQITDEHGEPVEPPVPILNHHFMFRNEEDTRLRLTALCGPDPKLNGLNRSKPDDVWIQEEGAMTRFRNMDHIYRGEWDKARMPHMQATPELKDAGIPLQHWSHWFREDDYTPRIT